MKKIIFIILFALISVYSACVTGGNYNYCPDFWFPSCSSNPGCTSCCSSNPICSQPPVVKGDGTSFYVTPKSDGIFSVAYGVTYGQLCSDAADYTMNAGGNCIPYTYRCTSRAEADSLDCTTNGGLWDGSECGEPQDTLCVNIPLSISAQLGTSARAYYVKNEDGSLTKILNEGNSDRLCSKSIEQGTGETKVINNLVGPDGENYGTFCQGSCESAGLSNGGQISCNTFGCHESNNQSGSINPNDYGAGSGDFGAGTGGGFGSGGGSGGGDGSGIIGDSVPPIDTSSSAPSWSDGCMVLNLQTCTCDGFTYVGSSGNTATVYNHKTGQTGTCGLDFTPEVSSCPVDWTTCNFKKSSNDTTNYNIDSMRVDSSGDWEYNYFPILSEINASIKALDYNQNSNAKDMQNFFNNYTGSSFGGGGSGGSWDTTILEFPDTNIDMSNWMDSINDWREQASGLIDAMGVFSLDSFVSDTNINYDTNEVVGEILDVAKSITDSAAYLFNIDFSDLGGSSNCPAFLSQTRYIELYTGTQVPIDYSYLCTIEIFGKPLFELIRVVLRLLVSLSCAFAIFKATVGFRE
jgi:uncharacterized membrane protein YgcG